ncbi:MAG: hypothetical protein U0175_08345 [Caldilineaceae bacterium]
MSARYQMQPRNATLRRFFLIALFLPLLFILFLSTASPTTASAATASHSFQLAPQQTAADLAYVFLLPTEENTIALSAHIASIKAVASDNGETVLQVAAQFRFKNSARSPAVTNVRLNTPISGTLPPDLYITVNGQPTERFSLDGGGEAINIQLAAEASLNVALNYSLSLPSASLQAIRYPITMLSNWQRRISISVRIDLADQLPAQSVVQVAPEGWIFPAESGGAYAVRWLFDGLPGNEPFSVTFIQPSFWQQIADARAASATGSSADFLRLGDLYTQLLTQSNDQLRSGFYAQALAAYTQGIEQSNDGALSADLQRRLAQLYRSQTVTPSGIVNPDYAQLTVQAANAALQLLPADDGRRPELNQWRTDALTVLFNEARRQNDWESARTILDQLSDATQTNGNTKFVAEARRRLIIQQALQLLEQGNRQAAITLAGQEIGADELRAPSELTSLFESWQVTVTISPGGIETDWIGLPGAEQSQTASAAVQELVAAWKARTTAQGFKFSVEPAAVMSQSLRQPLHLNVQIPAGTNGLPLAEATPLRTDWALFRTLFSQLTAQIERTPQLFRQQISMQLAIDLRSVTGQWQAMSDNLEQRAKTFETQANSGASATDSEAEATLRAQIQLANYRGAAATWATLSRNSTIALTLASSGEGTDQQQTWLLTPASPAQTLALAATTVNWGRVLVAVAGVLIALFLISGILWWLL